MHTNRGSHESSLYGACSSTGGDCDLIGLGVSAISKVGPTYSQSLKELEPYYESIDSQELPVLRGIELTPDDLVRRAVIQALACHFALAKESIEIAYLIDFDRYFATEMVDLARLEDDGLVELDDGWITVKPRGRLLVRAVCMVFDKYLRAVGQRAQWGSVQAAQTALFVTANVLMIFLGLYVAGWGRAVLRLESAGRAAWRAIEPLRRRFYPIDTTLKALSAGAVWGWVPCGLV